MTCGHRSRDAPSDHNYPRLSTHALGQILRLSLATQSLARQQAPLAGSILVITTSMTKMLTMRSPARDGGIWTRDRGPIHLEQSSDS